MPAKQPRALFDSLENLKETEAPKQLTPEQQKDFIQARAFLLCYSNNIATFNSYRREIERLLQWSQLKAKKNT